MKSDRKLQSAPVAIKQRPAAAVQRSAVPARTLQERLGNHGTQAFARSIQRASKVSKPNEPAELEAEATARRVVRMPDPAKPVAAAKETAKGTVQRAEGGAPVRIPSSGVNIPGGAPLPAPVRSFMEPRFGANFGNVRIHTGESAAQQSADLGAHAFTVGEHVFFGRDNFQPQSAGGRELIAHELAHTIQQGAAVQRSEPRVQRFGVKDALDWIADKARYIPGFSLLTIILGMNPINWEPVERNGANILRALLELIPVAGPLLAQALENYGIFAKVGAWVETQIRTLGLVGSALKAALDKFLDSLSWKDIFHLGDVYERGKRIFTDPIDRLLAFGKSLAKDILGFIRDAVVIPLGKLAEGTRGYDLLRAILGFDPVTGKPYPRNAETLIGGFMKFIGQEEVWENIKKAHAAERAFAWFQHAVQELSAFVKQIPSRFIATFKSLEIIDLVLPWKAFAKVGGLFLNLAGEFLSWGGKTVWRLLEIIFEVVSPETLAYLRRTGAALIYILKHPVEFAKKVIAAAKLGFNKFSSNFLTHVTEGLIDWLTGSLPGVYIPKDIFSLTEIAKFALSVLGLTWDNVRAKLVKVIGEPAMKVLEKGLGIVVILMRDGPAAAWEKLKEDLSDLKAAVIGGITNMLVEVVVTKGIAKLVSFFIPGVGFISAIISIYDAIKVFVQKIAQLVQVVKSFLDSMTQIASGAIDAAASNVENALKGILTLAINVLASFAVGNVAAKVREVIDKIRARVDKALDKVVSWIVGLGKSLLAKGKAAVKKAFAWVFATRKFKDAEGQEHSLYVNDSGVLIVESAPRAAKVFVDWYVKENGGDAKLVEGIKGLISKAEKVVEDIDKASAATTEGQVPAPAKQQELLKLNTEIAALLGKLVSGDRNIGKLEQKYLLEGQVGTYAGMPKPVGDQLTPDHQPQATVIRAAAEFFRKVLGIEGSALAERAENRAAKGYAINLHFQRHIYGATYGRKGETHDGFLSRLIEKAGKLKKDAAETEVVKMLRGELDKDVRTMKEVASRDIEDPAWKQLSDEVKPKKKAMALKKQIADRIEKGENQLASQPLDL